MPTGKKGSKIVPEKGDLFANPVLKTDRDWEVLFKIIDPATFKTWGYHRPRRMSIHTAAAITGRDATTLLKEMEESGKVAGYRCPDVSCVIFYLDELAAIMVDTRTAGCWKQALAQIESDPPGLVKGFARFKGVGVKGAKTGSAMPHPFMGKEDLPYIENIKKGLKEHGYTAHDVSVLP